MQLKRNHSQLYSCYSEILFYFASLYLLKWMDVAATEVTVPAGNYMFKVNYKDFNGLVLVSLLLTLNIFHTFFYYFYCWLWTGKCWLGHGAAYSLDMEMRLPKTTPICTDVTAGLYRGRYIDSGTCIWALWVIWPIKFTIFLPFHVQSQLIMTAADTVLNRRYIIQTIYRISELFPFNL